MQLGLSMSAISNPAAHGGLVTEERFSELPLQILLLFPDYQIADSHDYDREQQ